MAFEAKIDPICIKQLANRDKSPTADDLYRIYPVLGMTASEFIAQVEQSNTIFIAIGKCRGNPCFLGLGSWNSQAGYHRFESGRPLSKGIVQDCFCARRTRSVDV